MTRWKLGLSYHRMRARARYRFKNVIEARYSPWHEMLVAGHHEELAGGRPIGSTRKQLFEAWFQAYCAGDFYEQARRA